MTILSFKPIAHPDYHLVISMLEIP